MKKLFSVLSACLLIVLPLQAQCDLDFDFVNTGSNMTAFFTPPAAASIYSELGDGVVGAFYLAENGEFVCASSATFTGNQLQLAVMANDATTTEKDGFNSGEAINWFYQSTDGSSYSLSLAPSDNFVINAMTFINSSAYSEIDCGGGTDGTCPPLDVNFVNTGSNMTLFLTSPSLLSDLGNGTVGVYFLDDNGVEICGGASGFSGGQVQIAAMGNDATTTVKDGFSAGEAIVWKFESNDGSQYNLTPSPHDVFTLNATSFVVGMSNEAISCSVDVDGCTDNSYLEYNSSATIDDGSCLTIAVNGCTNSDYMEYNASANVDDGSCITMIVEGCTNDSYLEFNSNATIDDGSCLTIALYGCTDSDYLEYSSAANVNDGSCVSLIIEGCTNDSYIEFNANANVDNNTCETLIVLGCTDSNATNFDATSNTSDGSCEYDLIGAGCEVSFETLNTGSNHTIMIPSSLANTFDLGSQIGVFYIAADGSAVCAGSSVWTGQTMQIVAFADDTTTEEVDGLAAGSPFLFLAQSGDDVYMVTTTFQSPSMANFAVNGLSFVSSFDLELACSVEHVGCTDLSACNYDASANTNDNSCEYANANFDCSGACLNDSDNDGVCDELEIVGCMDSSAANYNQDATDAGACDYLGCTDISACNFDEQATIADASCNYPETNFDCSGSCLNDSDNDGVCNELEIVGCTDMDADNYNPNATDSGVCDYAGCTDSNYLEYDADANTEDGTCETLIVLGCTDSNATNFDSTSNTNDGSCEYDLIGAGCEVSFETLNTGSNHTIMIPSSLANTFDLGTQIGVFYIAADGSAVCAGSSVWTGQTMQIVAFGDDTTTEEVDGLAAGSAFLFLAQSGDDVYMVSTTFSSPSMANFAVNGLSFVSGFDLELACSVEHLGCIDINACNFDSSANVDDSSCEYPLDNFDCSGACLNDSDNDGICDELEVFGCTDITQSNYNSLATEDNNSCISWESAYNSCLESGGDDGVTQSDVDAVQALLDAIVPEDGVTQSDVDAVQALLDAIVPEDGVTQSDVDAVQALLDAIVPEDGVTQSDVDAVQALLDAVVPEDGITQADLDAANSTISLLQTQLDEALANTGASCDPIYVDLLAGWNIIGFTLNYSQDVVATLDPIVDAVQIVKNNAANVYWPEYGFNGIGDFIPGQGYQIRMYNEVSNYTFPDTDGQRMNLNLTVPSYVYDLPILNHPNDIKSLVRVVNMLGQEVSPDDQFKGTILLYLFNDGTTEKRIVE